MSDPGEELVLERRGHAFFSDIGQNEKRRIKIEILMCKEVREVHILKCLIFSVRSSARCDGKFKVLEL